MGKKILVVDDEPKILLMVEEYLKREGYEVITAFDGASAIGLTRTREPDLVVLDVMLPDQSGFQVCAVIRSFSSVPVVMLTARSEEIDKLVGLETGADDYITKPFSLRELGARIRAILRRTDMGGRDAPESEKLEAGPLTLDPLRYEACLEGNPVSLTGTEFKIVYYLAVNRGQVFSRLQLLEKVFGQVYEGYERSIDTHISNIRRKIEADPSHPTLIKTVYGIGYKFAPETEGKA